MYFVWYNIWTGKYMGMQMFLFHGFVYPACWSRIFFVLSRFFCILFVFYESFIPFMMHCLWSKCQSSMIVCPTSVCVHYVLVAWWIPNDYNLTTCVYFIRLKLDLSCHLHVKHPLLLELFLLPLSERMPVLNLVYPT